MRLRVAREMNPGAVANPNSAKTIPNMAKRRKIIEIIVSHGTGFHERGSLIGGRLPKMVEKVNYYEYFCL
jgi:hypothetical protein